MFLLVAQKDLFGFPLSVSELDKPVMIGLAKIEKLLPRLKDFQRVSTMAAMINFDTTIVQTSFHHCIISSHRTINGGI